MVAGICDLLNLVAYDHKQLCKPPAAHRSPGNSQQIVAFYERFVSEGEVVKGKQRNNCHISFSDQEANTCYGVLRIEKLNSHTILVTHDYYNMLNTYIV